MSEQASAHRYTLVYRPRTGRVGTQIVVPSGFGDRLNITLGNGHRRRPPGVTTRVSAPSRTGARTVTIIGRVRTRQTWTVTIRPR